MKKTIFALTAVLAASVVLAEEEAEKAAPAESETAAEAPKPAAPAEAAFTVLPFCRTADFPAEVRKNGTAEWIPVEEGRFYPLGSAFRTKKGGRLILSFGAESSVTIADEAAFATRAQGLDVKSRTLEGVEGVLSLDLSAKLKKGDFSVAFPGFTVVDLIGQATLTRQVLGDGDAVVVRCVTGSLGLQGRHFSVPEMRAANEVKIRTSHDNLETILYGTSGDYLVKLDQGIKQKSTVDDEGKVTLTPEPSSLDWHLSPKTKVQINRAVPALGERMSVAIMTFDAAGNLKNNFAYSEGRAEVNSGELVKSDGSDAAEVAKKAAEATETTAADADAEEEGEEKKESDSNNENKNKEDSDKE